MSEENIAFRLKFLIENLGMSSSQFADKCDIARPTLSQLLTGRNKKISDLLVKQIHVAYPALSILWLMFGEGDMWMNTSKTKSEYSDNLFEMDNTSTGKPENPRENREFPSSGHNKDIQTKENGVKSCQNNTNNSNFEQVDNIIKNGKISDKIENFREKPRKVVQVTIYYDDSTFQTFYPKN